MRRRDAVRLADCLLGARGHVERALGFDLRLEQ